MKTIKIGAILSFLWALTPHAFAEKTCDVKGIRLDSGEWKEIVPGSLYNRYVIGEKASLALVKILTDRNRYSDAPKLADRLRSETVSRGYMADYHTHGEEVGVTFHGKGFLMFKTRRGIRTYQLDQSTVIVNPPNVPHTAVTSDGEASILSFLTPPRVIDKKTGKVVQFAAAADANKLANHDVDPMLLQLNPYAMKNELAAGVRSDEVIGMLSSSVSIYAIQQPNQAGPVKLISKDSTKPKLVNRQEAIVAMGGVGRLKISGTNGCTYTAKFSPGEAYLLPVGVANREVEFSDGTGSVVSIVTPPFEKGESNGFAVAQ